MDKWIAGISRYKEISYLNTLSIIENLHNKYLIDNYCDMLEDFVSLNVRDIDSRFVVGLVDKNVLIGCYSLENISIKGLCNIIHINNCWIRKSVRGLGLFNILFNHLNQFTDQLNYNELTAYCTQYGLQIFLDKGFTLRGKKDHDGWGRVYKINHQYVEVQGEKILKPFIIRPSR